MFTKSQQDLLKSVGRNPNHLDFGKPNSDLDVVLNQLRRENPSAFLMDVDLDERVFIDQPVSAIRLKGYINPLLEQA